MGNTADPAAFVAAGEVAVPYGVCTEPSNVAAGGPDCPPAWLASACPAPASLYPASARSALHDQPDDRGPAGRLRPTPPPGQQGPHRRGQDGDPINVSAIARAAGVDRTFLYRHPDLLGQVHTAEATPSRADYLAGFL